MSDKDITRQEEPPFSEYEKKLFIVAYEEIQETIDTTFYDPKKSFIKITEKLGLIKEDKIKEGLFQKLSKYLINNFDFSLGLQASSVVASVFFIGIMLGIYVGNTPSKPASNNTSIDTLRSSENITQVVDSLEVTIRKWEDDLLKLRIEHVVSFEKSGNVNISFPVNEITKELLIKNRIEPVNSSWVVLSFEKAR
jgi:hypothetical protein